MSRKKKDNSGDYLNLPGLELDDRAKKSIAIVIIAGLGLVSLLGLFNLSGHFGIFVAKWLTLIFGYGKWLVPLIFLYWAAILTINKKRPLKFSDYLGLGLFFVSYQTLFHFFIHPARWQAMVKAGQGGGYIGWGFSQAFQYLFGFWGGVVTLAAIFLISIVLVTNTSLSKIIGRESFLAAIFSSVSLFFKSLFSGGDDKDEETDGRKYIDEARESVLGAWQKKSVDVVEAEEFDEGDSSSTVSPAAISAARPKVQEQIVWPKKQIKIDLPIELLNNKAIGKAVGGDVNESSLKIKRTLSTFGIEVEMAETKVGPTVTQYTFKPVEGVKLSRITTLNNDLSLALAASPIRIEAPIPGQSLVGVEVPNKAKAIVGLREILEDNSFKSRKNNLQVALGKDVSGSVWISDLTKMPHLLVAGATNSGKSVCLNAIITGLLYQNNPEDLRFIMVDPKRVELPAYNGIPHLLTPVITEVAKTINALKWCLNEMDRRYDILSKAGKKNIQSYNQGSKERLPYIVFIIDELADFMMTSGKEMEAAIIRLAQMSRAIGIHLILATQRPSVDVITGLIKANIPARIAFSVASLVDSKTILDQSGAEKLLGQGDMLFKTAEMAKPKRIQGAFLSEAETNDIVNYLKEQSGPAEYLEGVTDRQKVSGTAGVGLDGTHGDEDELFEAAKEIIIKANKASTSMLQRRLSIGYGRAAKILDMLEESGIIGPVNGAKPREVLVTQEQYENSQSVAIPSAALHQRVATAAPDSYLSGEEGDDGVLDFSNDQDAEEEEEIEEAVEELSISQEEEEEMIEDENEILEDIRTEDASDDAPPAGKNEKSNDQSLKRKNPLEDDDEMFFSR